MKSFSTFQEDLRNWFNPNHPDGGWKRVNTKGEVVGDCAREPGEPKPKCMSNAIRASLSKKEKASAVRRKRKEDPNPERQGEPINVKSKVNENMEQLDEKNQPTNPKLWARAVAQARAKFDVYPSAYANGWASKWYKEHGGGWKTVSEAKEEQEYDYEGDMAMSDLRSIIHNAQKLHDMLEPNTNLPEWCQSKITLAEDYISTVANYITAEMSEGVDECWKGYTAAGMKMKNGQKVPNCVPVKEDIEQLDEMPGANMDTRAVHSHLKKKGWKLSRTSGGHDVFTHDSAEHHITVPRHKQLKAPLVKGILKQSEIKESEIIVTPRKNVKTPPAPGTYAHDVASGKYAKFGFTKTGKPTAQKKREQEQQSVKEGSTGWHPSSTVKNPNFNDELSGRRVSPPGKRLKSGKLSADERGSQERIKTLIKYTKNKGGLTGPKGHLPEQSVSEETEQIDEISAQTKSSYVEKAKAQVKELQPHAKKGEYRDLAKNLIARRKKGIAMASEQASASGADEGRFMSGPPKKTFKPTPIVTPQKIGEQTASKLGQQSDEIPFTGPYHTVKKNVKDKSGSVHTPMSRAKHLAKTAARRQAGIKEEQEPEDSYEKTNTPAKRSLSKTAGMVKDLATKAKKNGKEKPDTFQPEPELSSQIIKV